MDSIELAIYSRLDNIIEELELVQKNLRDAVSNNPDPLLAKALIGRHTDLRQAYQRDYKQLLAHYQLPDFDSQ